MPTEIETDRSKPRIELNIDWIFIFSATSPIKHWRLKH